MTDWSKLKVAELKEECKARDISLTGLKLKQHFVEKLEEFEAAQRSTLQPTEDPSQQDKAQDDPESEKKAEAISTFNDTAPQANGHNNSTTPSQKQPEWEEEKGHAERNAPGGEVPEKDAIVPEPVDVEKAETVKQEDVAQSGPSEIQSTPVPENGPASGGEEEPRPERRGSSSKTTSDDAPPYFSSDRSVASVPGGSPENLPSEFTDDQKKRKRRSLTPVPSADDIARKRARADDGVPTDVLEQVANATEPAEAIRDGLEGREKPAIQNGVTEAEISDIVAGREKEADTVVEVAVTAPAQDTQKGEATRRAKLPSSPSRASTALLEERTVAPATHPATSSLYIRNFKRPLHIPTLRNHISSIARSRSGEDESDPIRTFYLDSIRTHAFVSFTSVSAASRVRSAMHDTRFPDEALREPLFVDFVPDDKVQDWIDQETGGGNFGRAGGGRRYEVVYGEEDGRVTAVLQDADTRRGRPDLDRGHSGPTSTDTTKMAPTAPGIHPDRAALVRHDETQQGRPPPAAASRSSGGGTGFKALDELFSFTTTKPKLYYKPVPAEIAEDRMAMIQELRVGHAEMGRSGDEGMKRYTFESYRGREEWVDKGPEFGFGKKGQERLAGIRGRSGYRGGGRGGDTWRGR